MANEKVETTNFEKNIFINCPFDNDYVILLRPLIFTILYCDFNPRIASERHDSGEYRLDKIKELIESSMYSIHDLSRVKYNKQDKYYRLNMSFEIGLDIGCRLYHPDKKYKNKKALILENEKYSYQKALSDLSGIDVKCHQNEAEEIVIQLRTWFCEIDDNISVPPYSLIWDNYNIFYAELLNPYNSFKTTQKDLDRMPIAELMKRMKVWINKNVH